MEEARDLQASQPADQPSSRLEAIIALAERCRNDDVDSFRDSIQSIVDEVGVRSLDFGG